MVLAISNKRLSPEVIDSECYYYPCKSSLACESRIETFIINLSKREKSALGYWRIGIQYLHMTEIVASEVTSQGNESVIISDSDISWDEFFEQTKWSDHNLILPLLFIFYQGIENALKGFLVFKGELGKPTHSLTRLLESFKHAYQNKNLDCLLARYIIKTEMPNLLASFCSASSISADDFYQALKYPESTKGNFYTHSLLEYQGEGGLDFFYRLKQDIIQIRREVVALGRSLIKTAN